MNLPPHPNPLPRLGERGSIETGPGGKLAENVMHFARLLRGAGLPVGPDRVIDALDALQIAGLERNARRTSVDHAADRRPVALAPGRDAE